MVYLIHVLTFKALSLPYCSKEPLRPKPRTALTVVGYEVEGLPALPCLPVTPSTEPNPKAEDEDDEDTDGHQ